MKRFNQSGLSVLSAAFVLLAAGGLWSCTKPGTGENTEPGTEPVSLTDQIQYDGGTAIDIQSAIYEVADGLYSFYLSPTSGITTVEGMTGADDYLKVVLSDPKGTVDISSDDFEIEYRDIHVMPQTMNDVASCQLSADLVTDSRLNLYVDVTMDSGKKLLARYNNTCNVAEVVIPPLSNQYEYNGERTSIGSVVAWYNPSAGNTVYHFYEQEGISAPSEENPAGMTFTVDDGRTFPVTLSTVNPESVAIRCGDFANTSYTEGTADMQISDGQMTLSISAQEGDDVLNVEYSGAFVSGYDLSAGISMTSSGSVTEGTPSALFRYTDATRTRLVIGDAAEASAVADVMSGNFAVQLDLAETQLGTTIDLSENPDIVSVSLYDYNAYTTSSAVSSGTVSTKTLSDGGLYYSFDITFDNGYSVSGEWTGLTTAFTELVDLTPVEPVVPMIRFTEGQVPISDYDREKPIVSMQVRKESNFELNGGESMSDYGGATFDAYVFYFCTEGSNPDNPDGGTTEWTYTPKLTIPVSIATGNDVSLAETDDPWQLRYNISYLYYGSGGYSHDYASPWSTTYNCPDDAVVSVSFDPDSKIWKVRFSMTDTISQRPYGQGYGTGLTIEWEGMASRYRGSEPNEIPKSDYLPEE